MMSNSGKAKGKGANCIKQSVEYVGNKSGMSDSTIKYSLDKKGVAVLGGGSNGVNTSYGG